MKIYRRVDASFRCPQKPYEIVVEIAQKEGRTISDVFRAMSAEFAKRIDTRVVRLEEASDDGGRVNAGFRCDPGVYAVLKNIAEASGVALAELLRCVVCEQTERYQQQGWEAFKIETEVKH